ncbi:TetR/AcrR family transcriptional regulator [Nocardia sp. FBN12]|uniref:TetR/AcrR family transcriptional regulator n=1 Tax=Nocardia sp. FBN12 TaxID=3419766 RepID=UPI003D03D304
MNQPGQQRRIDEIGEESRRRIMDAAEELFAERGYDRTSFVDIAERSGISRGSIPWHFKNKDGLVMAVVERAIGRAMPQERYPELPSMTQVMADYADMLQQLSPRMLFMILTEAMNSTGALHEQYCDFLSQRREGLQQWFRIQRPEGVDPAVAEVREADLAAVISGAAIGIQLQWQIDPDSVDLERALNALAALIDSQERLLQAGTAAPQVAERTARKGTVKATAKKSDRKRT